MAIRNHPELKICAADWFHKKFHIPFETYLESIEECIKNKNIIPQWYVVRSGNAVIGGLGVIDNDFHNRKDLKPNICALYVERYYRCRGIAGALLNYACEDMRKKGIDTLYLVTDHTTFYERYGWEFLCMVQGDGDTDLSRMYIHKTL